MSMTPQEIDALRQEFVTQAINHRFISNAIARSHKNVEYCNECFSVALETVGRNNLSHTNLPPGEKRDGVRAASTFILGYLTAKSMEVTTND